MCHHSYKQGIKIGKDSYFCLCIHIQYMQYMYVTLWMEENFDLWSWLFVKVNHVVLLTFWSTKCLHVLRSYNSEIQVHLFNCDYKFVVYLNLKHLHTHHNVSVSVITSGPVPGELQDGISTVLHPSDQEPVLAWIDGRQGLTLGIAVLHRVVIYSECYGTRYYRSGITKLEI